MYRVIAIVGGGLLLTACASSTPNWFSLDGFTGAPVTDAVQFESEPPGAEAKTSTGQTCRTPCSLSLPTNAALSVTFTLNGYLPETEKIELISDGGPKLRPNPVLVELSPAPPSAKKPGPRRKPKPVAKKPAASAAPASGSTTASGASPWPTPKY
ncbi:MAG: hypothetical protein ACR2K5_13810 [Pseudolabrys sp.]